MKKVLAFLLSMALLVAPAGCAAEPGQLTLERVEQLAEKGEALTWSDFEGYAYEEAGSGLYIRVYDVNEEYYVMVGGPSLEESPLYVRLVSRDNGEQCCRASRPRQRGGRPGDSSRTGRRAGSARKTG